MREKYQLRHAVGCYWLLNMEQSGKDYIQPVGRRYNGTDCRRISPSISDSVIGSGGRYQAVCSPTAEAGNERMDGVGEKWIFYWWAVAII